MKFDYIIKQVEDNPYSAFFYTPSVYKKAMSYLFVTPSEMIPVNNKEDIHYASREVQKLLDKKYLGYTLINYEAGFLFEKKLFNLLQSENKKLIQFFFFKKSQVEAQKSSKIIFGAPPTLPVTSSRR